MRDEGRELYWRWRFYMRRRRAPVLWGGRPGWQTQVGSSRDRLEQALLADTAMLLREIGRVTGQVSG